MKVKKAASRTNSENESTDADSSEMKKRKLKKDIVALQSLIEQVERRNGDLTKFGDVTNTEMLLPTTRENRAPGRVPDLDALFRREIYTFAGFYCAKVTKAEYVFNFVAADNGSETFSVQIWNRDGRVSLGKWVMPMSVDMKKILQKTPIHSLVTVIPFLKNCKRQVDCYSERKSQFDELKDHISDTSNCEIDANVGFMLIKLHLLGIYRKPTDSYIDLTIDLSYKSNETRPCTIGVDWSLKKDPSQLQENEMKSYVKFLKNQRILEGFRHMTETTHPVFLWEMEEYVNSPLELNNSSDSEEESFLLMAKRKRKKSTTKRRKERELNERWKKRLRQTSVATRSRNRDDSTDEENEDSSAANRDSGRTRSSSANTLERRSRSPEKSKERPLSQRSTKSAPERSTTSKYGRKLRQTTISFVADKTTEADFPARGKAEVKERISASENPKASNGKAKKSETARKTNIADETGIKMDSSRVEKSAIPRARPIGILSTKKTGVKRINRATTSTPLQKTAKGKVKFAAMSDVAISPIASADENEK